MEAKRKMGRRLISDERFNKELKTFTEFALDELKDAEPGEDPPPFLCLMHPAGEDAFELTLIVVGTSFDNNTKYALFESLVRQQAEEDERQVAAAYLAMCSWKSIYRGEVPEDRPEPRHDPNRKEVLIVSGVTLDMRHNHSSTIYDRNRKGRPRPKRPEYLWYIDEEARVEGDPTFSPNRVLVAFMRGYAKGYTEGVR